MIGSIVFTTGASLVWPFLSIYIQEKLEIPLRYSTLLNSLRAFSGVLASFFFAGSFADRFDGDYSRKRFASQAVKKEEMIEDNRCSQ